MTLFDDRAAHELDSDLSVSAVSEQSAESSNGSAHSSVSQTESVNPNPVQEEKPAVSTAVEEKPAAPPGHLRTSPPRLKPSPLKPKNPSAKIALSKAPC